jgi:hypothetical protein
MNSVMNICATRYTSLSQLGVSLKVSRYFDGKGLLYAMVETVSQC